MKFTIDIDKKTVKCKDYQEIDCPKEIVASLKELFGTMKKLAVLDTKVVPTTLTADKNRLWFGVGNAKLYYWDLDSLELRDLNSTSINPKRLEYNIMSVNNLSFSHPWVKEYYCYWRKLVYGDTFKTKIHYLFTELTGSRRDKLKICERLLKAGFPGETCSILLKSVKDFSSSSLTGNFGITKKHLLLAKDYIKRRFENDRRMYPDDYSNALDVNRGHYIEHLPDFDSTELFDSAFSLISNDYNFEILDSLRTNYEYETRRLLEYVLVDLPEKQGFTSNFNERLRCLRDYANTAYAASGTLYEKYPKYLKTEHDKCTLKLNKLSKVASDVVFSRMYEAKWVQKLIDGSTHIVKDAESISHTYRVLLPKDSKDIIEEGKELSHCVASYIDRICRGECVILSFREKAYGYQWNRTLTVEVRNGVIVQVRGKFNRMPEQHEMDALFQYAVCCDLEFEQEFINTYNLGKDVANV